MKKLIILISICCFSAIFSSCEQQEDPLNQRLCTSCFGSKVCMFCDGTKICHVCEGQDLDILGCTFCNNTGKCQRCRATGKCTACGGKGYIAN